MVSLTTDERMFLEGSAGISVCSPGRQGQKNSSWQQCFNGWLQGRRQAERKHFRIQIISQQIHVNFYQEGISDHLLTFALVFAKTTFGSWEYSGFSQSSPLFNGKHLCGGIFISSVFLLFFTLSRIKTQTSFSQDLSPEEAPGGRQSQRCEPEAKKSSPKHVYKYI